MYFKNPIITIQEFKEILNRSELIILDCSIDKFGKKLNELEVELIPNSLHFDIENHFSDHNSDLPHTLVNETTFTKQAQLLGINNDSLIVCYDRWGVYSSPRAWWMFKAMGFENVFVLNGGILAWKESNFPISTSYKSSESIGNFNAKLNIDWYANPDDVLNAIDKDSSQIIDARSAARFNALVDEPRPGLRKGHIKNSTNIPFENVLLNDYYKSNKMLNDLFKDSIKMNEVIFSCGSGITASILALANFQINPKQLVKVYDGSWAEWGKNENLPIE